MCETVSRDPSTTLEEVIRNGCQEEGCEEEGHEEEGREEEEVTHYPDLARPRGIGWPRCRPIPDFFCPFEPHVSRGSRLVLRLDPMRAGGTALGLAVFLQFGRRPAQG